MDLFRIVVFVTAGSNLIMAMTLLALRWKDVRGTTLVSAWGWALAALMCWFAAWCVTICGDWLAPHTPDAVWYFAGVMTVCPGIAVLGARRPVSRVWSAFVVAPLILVLCMPLLNSWHSDTGRFGWIVIETPLLLGFGLVVLMGCGNYIGTRFTGPAVAVAVATMCVMFSFTNNSGKGAFLKIRPIGGWLLVAMLFAAAVIFACRRKKNTAIADAPDDELPNLEFLWQRFVNTFGIVWAKRVGERINWTAQEERLPVRLEHTGLVWTQKDVSPEQQAHARSRLEHTLQILLKRFVNEEWKQRRPPGGDGPHAESQGPPLPTPGPSGS